MKVFSRGFFVATALAFLVQQQHSSSQVEAKSFSEYEQEFEVWMQKHHLTFVDAREFVKRLKNYIANDMLILKHNSDKKTTYELGHNEFSHLSWDEFRSKMIGFKMPQGYVESKMKQTNSTLFFQQYKNVQVPDSMDWVEKGGVTPVKNQGMCGSCWAFSTTGALEGATFVASKKLVSLSEQELVDCDDNGDMGCNGGLMDHAFEWVENHRGICPEDDYPYHAEKGVCRDCKEAVKVTGYHDVPPNNEEALRTAVAQQPVSVAIQADQKEFQFYKSGVFDKECGTQLDHGVLAVGYGTDQNGGKFWKIKNSWGDSWGEKGYIRLAREFGKKEGQCGVAMVPSYPFAHLISDDEEPTKSTEEEVVKEPVVKQTVASSAKISQCGDKLKSIVKFDDLEITPKDPKRGKPVTFYGNGHITKGFANAKFKLGVKLAGERVFQHSGALCGETHIPLPLGLGHIDVHGFNCPMKEGTFNKIAVDVNLPIIAPSGNYEISLVAGDEKDASSLFCVQAELELGDEQQYMKSRVYEYLPEM